MVPLVFSKTVCNNFSGLILINFYVCRSYTFLVGTIYQLWDWKWGKKKLLQAVLENTSSTISFSGKNYLLGMMFIFEKNIQNVDFWLVLFPLVVGST